MLKEINSIMRSKQRPQRQAATKAIFISKAIIGLILGIILGVFGITGATGLMLYMISMQFFSMIYIWKWNEQGL